MPWFIRLRLVVCLLLPFVFSCGQQLTSNSGTNAAKIEPTTTGVRGGSLTYRASSPPKTFNYLVADDEPSITMAFFLLNSRLVGFDHLTQKYVPGLAESWSVADDRQTVDVKLRDGLKFSNGQPITSDDVAFTLEAVYDERTKSVAFRDSLLINGKPISLKVVDPRTMQFIFPVPMAAVENYLYNLSALPKHLLEADHKAGALDKSWNITSPPESIVTSGAFTVESAAAGERIVLKRNPHYWKTDEKGTQLPYLDQLTIEVVPDVNQTLARLNQNTIDIADRLRPSDYASLTSTAGQVKGYDVGPALGVDYLWFNLNPAKQDGTPRDSVKLAWFSDVRVRKAVSAAVDRNSIAASTLQGLATPLYGFLSPANRAWADPNLPKIDYDLTRAAALLAEAGFVKRGTAESPELFDAQGNRVEFNLIVPAENEPRKLMAAVIQEDLAKLGIKMQVVPVEFKAVTEAWAKSYDYDAILLGLSVTDLEPSTFGNFLISSGSTHQWRPNQKTPATEWEAKVDQLFAEQAREADPEKRKAIFGEIQRIVADASPIVPIVARHVVSAANARIGNYSPSPMFPHSMWNADELFVKQ